MSSQVDLLVTVVLHQIAVMHVWLQRPRIRHIFARLQPCQSY